MATINANQLEEKTTEATNWDKLVVINGENDKVQLLDVEKFKGGDWAPWAPWTPWTKGNDGLSAYQIWINEGNSGWIIEFLEALKWTPWEDWNDWTPWQDWKSAYQVWLDAGNSGTETDFLLDITWKDGEDWQDWLSPDPRGEYDENTVYQRLAIVGYNWAGYISRKPENTDLPTNELSWLKIAEKWKDWAWDMIWANNLSELTDFALARQNLSVYSKTETDNKYALINHNHNLADLSEKSYNSLTDRPNLAVYSLIADIRDNLTSTDTDKPLSANQWKILKWLIDNINTLLASDDTTLDELQEIVDYIKQNKDDLANLSIWNIAWLQDALNDRQLNSNLLIAFQWTPDDTHYISEKLAKDNFDLKANLSGATFTGQIQTIQWSVTNPWIWIWDNDTWFYDSWTNAIWLAQWWVLWVDFQVWTTTFYWDDTWSNAIYQINVRWKTNTSKILWIWFNTTNDIWVIQAHIEWSWAYTTPIVLNPLGWNVWIKKTTASEALDVAWNIKTDDYLAMSRNRVQNIFVKTTAVWDWTWRDINNACDLNTALSMSKTIDKAYIYIDEGTYHITTNYRIQWNYIVFKKYATNKPIFIFDMYESENQNKSYTFWISWYIEFQNIIMQDGDKANTSLWYSDGFDRYPIIVWTDRNESWVVRFSSCEFVVKRNYFIKNELNVNAWVYLINPTIDTTNSDTISLIWVKYWTLQLWLYWSISWDLWWKKLCTWTLWKDILSNITDWNLLTQS